MDTTTIRENKQLSSPSVWASGGKWLLMPVLRLAREKVDFHDETVSLLPLREHKSVETQNPGGVWEQAERAFSAFSENTVLLKQSSLSLSLKDLCTPYKSGSSACCREVA